MFTTFKTAAIVAITVVAAHAVIGSASFSALQSKADQAVMPVVTAERIEVRPTQVVKMDRIEVVARKAAANQIALTRWNAAA
jgi:hypothetical protein